MGREFLPPEQADSWGEFHARLELEVADPGNPLIPVWWCAAGLLFATGLICCAYAVQDRHWWLWLCMLAPLGAVGVMAARAVERADQRRARAVELGRLQDAWQDHLDRASRTP